MVRRGMNEEREVSDQLKRALPDRVTLPMWHITNLIFVDGRMAIVNVYASEADYNAIFEVVPLVRPSGKIEVSVYLPRGVVRNAKPFMQDISENGAKHFRFYLD